MMLARRMECIAEPAAQWLKNDLTCRGMTLKNFPLFLCGASGLIQDAGRNRDFADVVEKCAPSQTLQFATANTEFAG